MTPQASLRIMTDCFDGMDGGIKFMKLKMFIEYLGEKEDLTVVEQEAITAFRRVAGVIDRIEEIVTK